MSNLAEIKFGTDGWRAIIADDYTVDNVKRLSHAVALWMIENKMNSVVVGHDCRFGGKMFVETVENHLRKHGIKVYKAEGIVSTPMISLGVVNKNADIGIVITASHNPPSFNGFKLKSSYGGPTIPSDIAEVENRIPATMEELDVYKYPVEKGEVEIIDLEQLYIDHIRDSFDLQAINESGIRLAYDAMYGAGQNVIKRLFPDAYHLHCELNPGFDDQPPEPIHKNLSELSAYIAGHHIDIGLANDGDADRIGLYDESGKFVDSHHILLLLLYYQHNFKDVEGDKVVVTFSVTDKMEALAEQYGYDFEVTPIGFKYIAEIMTKEKVLVGGEESGGLAVSGHIPERDGIWIGLLIMEFMAKTGKSLKELIKDIYNEVGSFSMERDDRHVDENVKQSIIENCGKGVYTQFGDYKVTEIQDIDGYKFRLGEGKWVMIRPSGTEPVLRIYAQGKDKNEVREILNATQEEIGIGTPG